MLRTIRNILVKIRDYYLVSIKWRNFKFGKNFHAGRRVFLWAKNGIEIGDNCYIGRDSQIETNVKFGNNILIANNVAFVGKYDHNYHEVGTPIRLASEIRDKDYNWKGLNEITIVEDDVWIGYGSIIISGVTIKTGSIIAAGSLVTKDVEEYSIYGGHPAKKLSDRFTKEEKIEHLRIING